MGRATSGVRRASASSIEIDFQYRGVRCRERIKLPATPRNLQYARHLLGQIRLEIEKGVFDYAAHFPKSPRAKLLHPKPAALVTVAQALREWMERQRPQIEHSTAIDYDRAIKYTLEPAFGRLALRDLSRPAIKAWIGDRPNLSAKRLTNVLSPLRQMLTEATHDGILDNDPMHGLKIKRRRGKEREDVDPFTPEEVAAILGKAEGQVRNLLAFAVGSGLRTSELIALRWAEVDFVAGAVLVRAAFVRGRRKAPKTQAGIRRVELTPLALDALRAQKAHTFLKGEEVFQNPNTGEPWGGDMQIRQRHWTPLLKRAGVRYRYPYQTRHTYASTMLSAGENVMWVARQLGHADWGVTARTYARFIPSIDPDAGAKGGGALPAFGQLSG